MTRLALPYNNFDEYFSSLGYTTRKGLRRKFRKTERAPKIEMEVVSDVAPYVDQIYPLYLQVHERSRFKFETLTKELFLQHRAANARAGAVFYLAAAWQDRRVQLCMVCGGTIYDECLGLDYNVALDLHLYFYTLRDMTRWAMEQGCGLIAAARSIMIRSCIWAMS